MTMLLAATLVVCAGTQVVSPAAIARDVLLPQLDGAPVIDGRLDDRAWANATRVTLAVQLEPGDNVPATESTEVWIGAGARHVYLAFVAHDTDPGAIRARVARRDDVGADDHVSITIDTDDARQRAYRFRFNPLGIQADGIYTVVGGEDISWDGVIASKGAVTPDGYVVEAAIPLETLRFRAGPRARWGLHLERWIARKAERSSWVPISRDNASYLGQMGTIGGLDRLGGGHVLDLTPTLTAAAGTERSSTAVPLSRRRRADVGLTAVFGVSSNVSLSATVNPDFSQVEADVPQITVNQRTAISFAEKRPFFLEGAEFFRSALSNGLRLLDTRTIVNPDAGVKLTGKQGPHAFGVLAASDAVADLDDNAFVAAGRYQRDLFRDSAFGATFVTRREGGASNAVGAVEARVRVRNVHTLGAQVARSTTSTGSGSLEGHAFRLASTTSARTWKIFLWKEVVSPGFRAASGFLSRPAYDESHVDVGYEWRPKASSWWTSFWPYVLATRSRGADGAIEFEYVDPAVQLTLPRSVQINAYMSFDHDRFAGQDLRYRFQSVQLRMNRFKRLTFTSRVRWGDGPRFDPAQPQVGPARLLRHEMTARLTDTFTFDALATRSQVRSRDDGTLLSRQDIFRLRANWQPSRAHGLRTVADYDSATRRVGMSVLYSFAPRPNTAIYLGYNDLLMTSDDDVHDGLGRPRPWDRLRRTAFVKASWGFRQRIGR